MTEKEPGAIDCSYYRFRVEPDGRQIAEREFEIIPSSAKPTSQEPRQPRHAPPTRPLRPQRT